MWGKKKYREIDRYKLPLNCTCMKCKNHKKNWDMNGSLYSCTVYPKERQIPPKIWNGNWAECEHYIPAGEERDKKE